MKIKIITSKPVDGQSELTPFIGNVYEALNLKEYYDNEIHNEMKSLGEVAVFLETGDKSPSILNKDEYEIVQ